VSKFITRCINKCNTNGIIHVGAHCLEEIEIYHEAGIYNIIWIEADSIICEEMRKKYPLEIILDFLVTDKCGDEKDFYISSNNGASSAIFPFGYHKTIYPKINMTSTIKLITNTLDNVLKGFVVSDYNTLVMDVQGAELLVLKGAKSYLKTCKYIITEVSTIPLYDGCVLRDELHNFINSIGFNKEYEKIHQEKGHGDAFYIRRKK